VTEETWIQMIRAAPIDWLEERLIDAETFLKEAKVILPQVMEAPGFRRMVQLTAIEVRLMQDELARRKRG
jgi:predicted HTH domain antitoxin